MDSETFRRLGHRLVDWIADYRESLPRRPVMSKVAPGAIRARFPSEPPARGGALAAALDRLEDDVLPGITHWNHPSFFAYFPSNTSFASVLADLLASGLGAQGMSWQTSPAVTEIEEVMMEWLRRMTGLDEGLTGVIHDTASTATLTALLCARERATGHGQARAGLQGEGAPWVVYASEHAHASVRKAALLAGFGADHFRAVESDERFAMDPRALKRAIEEDEARGRRPAAVVATIGTTSTTAVDPVAAIADVVKEHGAWLHVDAALAGTAMVLPELRPLFAGLERADSLVFNPHKWMGVGFDFSAYYVRDAEHLVRVMSTNPAYLATSQDGAVKNFRDWQIPLGRRFRALKLWFYLLDEGVDALQARVRRDLENAKWLEARLSERGWNVIAPVVLQTVCVRHVPPSIAGSAEAVDAHNLAIASRVNESGRAYLTTDRVRGRVILRLSIGAETTERSDVAALADLLEEAASGSAHAVP